MSLTAEGVSRLSVRRTDLNTCVSDTLKMIDDAITRAPKKLGRNIVECEIPSNGIDIPGLVLHDAQKFLYSFVLRSLVSRGFDARIRLLGPTKTMLYVAWNAAIDEQEKKAMERLIKTRRILDEEAFQRFVRGEDTLSQKQQPTLRSTERKKEANAETEEKQSSKSGDSPIPGWAAGVQQP